MSKKGLRHYKKLETTAATISTDSSILIMDKIICALSTWKIFEMELKVVTLLNFISLLLVFYSMSSFTKSFLEIILEMWQYLYIVSLVFALIQPWLVFNSMILTSSVVPMCLS